jgi:16S rRNA (cytosine1402-N4)-methyltransferase
MHLPVLKKEVLEILDPKPNQNFVDATFAEGGHTIEILERTKPKGKVLALEVDPVLFEKGKELERRFLGRLILKNESFANLKEIVEKENFKEISGILFDLGISSWHFEESERGFTFKKDEPLIMRYDADIKKLTAIDVLNSFSEREIEKILREFGQEKFAKSIAREIIKERKEKKILTTFQLVEIVRKALPLKEIKKRKIHFATKVFLALRIFVNQELENLKEGLKETLEILRSGGKVLVISFHSLEDKIVKNFFKEKEKEGIIKILTKKPIVPSNSEILKNKRSRSAKLRAVIKK